MCGIVGYIGKKQALPILLNGLHDLEYRGYDSAGIAILDNGKIERIRETGKVDNLIKKTRKYKLTGNIGIAHTRWATHGEVTEQNAHPHIAGMGRLTIVHNGIIENFSELKKELKDQNLESETDSEVLAKLIFENYKGDLLKAVQKALAHVRGTYGLLVMHADHPDVLIAARLGSPIAIGVGKGENYIASDVTPMLPYTKKVVFLNDGEVAQITPTNIKISNLKEQKVSKKVTQIDWNKEQAEKGGFENFMLKEIFDQPTVFEDAIRGRTNMKEGTAVLGGLNMNKDEIKKIKRIIIIGCGTASYAGMVGKCAFENLAGISAELDVSSEFRYRNAVIDPYTLVFALSQSGETLDTLMALREAKERGAIVRSIVNVIGSI